ncbi:type III effector protein [Streptomyces sp. NPDC005438]|uniref:type III effector protein n=1 Tax=Streptomyces sp. NPDC005438 TaxID=3156880 RepID=UPI0033B632BE
MTERETHPESSALPPLPTSFPAVDVALHTIDRAVHTAQDAPHEPTGDDAVELRRTLEAVARLRELRDQLGRWEPMLIEMARSAGASWADLASPLGVASRQAAERRYLRVRPGVPGATREERVRATRNQRAADRSINIWARANAADLRQLAGQITSLTDLPAEARPPVAQLADALGGDDAATLVEPLADTQAHLEGPHPELAARVDTLARHTERLRQEAVPDEARGESCRVDAPTNGDR